MLPDSFARLATVDSGFRRTYQQLEAFARRHMDWERIDAISVSKDFPLIDAFELGAALIAAVDRGVLRVKYTVLTPDGVVATDAFDSPAKIPRRLPDRFERYFDTTEQPLVTVFEEAKAFPSGGRARAAIPKDRGRSFSEGSS